RAASGGGALKPDATLTASYHAYEFGALCRPDKAFTPHPAVVQHRT
ncbi:TPA: hypothetical protein OTS17_003695, partial [Escherichia coli]|nr:hypothetical protein [Escherichia coli]